MSKQIILRIGVVISYCLINYTLVVDILGGLIIKILIHLLTTNSILLRGLSITYVLSLGVWILTLFWKEYKYENLILAISSIILICPLILNLFVQIKALRFEFGFIAPCFIFCALLLLAWREQMGKS
jgi:hypothetical protein